MMPKGAAVVLGMWCDRRHADAGVGIGMPALVWGKAMIKGTQNHKKNEFLQFSCFAKSFKKKEVFFSKT